MTIGHKGFVSLPAIFVASLILLLGFHHVGMGYVLNRNVSKRKAKNLKALAYASELLEFMRSNSVDQLTDYLAVNPINSAKVPYRFCSHINLLDRDSGNVLMVIPLPPTAKSECFFHRVVGEPSIPMFAAKRVPKAA